VALPEKPADAVLVTRLPDGETTHHFAPEPVDPCPLTWPGFASPEKVYRGMPPRVSWRAPLALVMDASLPLIPGSEEGIVAGAATMGQ
jgi:hypothetical protein